MTNDETQMTKEIRNPKTEPDAAWLHRPVSGFGIFSSFVIRHWDFLFPP